MIRLVRNEVYARIHLRIKDGLTVARLLIGRGIPSNHYSPPRERGRSPQHAGTSIFGRTPNYWNSLKQGRSILEMYAPRNFNEVGV